MTERQGLRMRYDYITYLIFCQEIIVAQDRKIGVDMGASNILHSSWNDFRAASHSIAIIISH
jgi:hypothetical protein